MTHTHIHPSIASLHTISMFTFLTRNANFIRCHFAAFSVTPLIASAIFYGVNGKFPVSFIDSLFLCYSAMTGTGLATVNLSTLTGLQQAILFVLMWIGDTVRGFLIVATLFVVIDLPRLAQRL